MHSLMKYLHKISKSSLTININLFYYFVEYLQFIKGYAESFQLHLLSGYHFQGFRCAHSYIVRLTKYDEMFNLNMFVKIYICCNNTN